MISMIIGVTGLILLSIGWFFETIKLMKEKKSKLDLKFAVLYTVGSLCLVLYSVQIMDGIFIVLNSLVAILSLISLIYSIKK